MMATYGQIPLEVISGGTWTDFTAQMATGQVYFLWVNLGAAADFNMPTAGRYLCMATKVNDAYGKAIAIRADADGPIYQRHLRNTGWSTWTAL